MTYFNNIKGYFSNKFTALKEKRQLKHETWSNKWLLQGKKYKYIDSLHDELSDAIIETGIKKTIISNHDRDGFYVAIGNGYFNKEERVHCVDPIMVFTLIANSIDDMVLNVSDKQPGHILYGQKINSDEDFERVKTELRQYIKVGEGARILQN